MAKRRRWGTGSRLAHGLATGTSDVMTLLLRDVLNDRNAARISQREGERDARTLARQGQMLEAQSAAQARRDLLNKLPTVASGDLSPEAYEAMAAAGGGLFASEFDDDYAGTGEVQGERVAHQDATRALTSAVRPPLRRRLESTVGKSIGEASSPEQLDPNAILGQILAADDRAVPGEAEPGMRVGGLRPEAYEYVARGEDKAHALRTKPTNVVTGKDPVTGQDFTRMVSPTEHAQGITTSPTPTQAGTFAGQQQVAQETATLDPVFQELKTRTLARMQNITEALTRQAKVDTATALAGAQKRGALAPDIIAAEANRERALSNVPGQSTESERRAAANWTPLVNAHANALLQESQGATLTPGAVEITGSSWLNPVLGSWIDPGVARYAQSARDFVTTLGYIRSGVQVRADEVDKFLATMFTFEGDLPEQIKQKQQSREILLGAMQAMVGRSAPEAARVLATAINAGQIPMTILTNVEIRPEIAREMLPLLSGVPVFDIDGNIISVRPR